MAELFASTRPECSLALHEANLSPRTSINTQFYATPQDVLKEFPELLTSDEYLKQSYVPGREQMNALEIFIIKNAFNFFKREKEIELRFSHVNFPAFNRAKKLRQAIENSLIIAQHFDSQNGTTLAAELANNLIERMSVDDISPSEFPDFIKALHSLHSAIFKVLVEQPDANFAREYFTALHESMAGSFYVDETSTGLIAKSFEALLKKAVTSSKGLVSTAILNNLLRLYYNVNIRKTTDAYGIALNPIPPLALMLRAIQRYHWDLLIKFRAQFTAEITGLAPNFSPYLNLYTSLERACFQNFQYILETLRLTQLFALKSKFEPFQLHATSADFKKPTKADDNYGFEWPISSGWRGVRLYQGQNGLLQ